MNVKNHNNNIIALLIKNYLTFSRQLLNFSVKIWKKYIEFNALKKRIHF